MLTDSHSVGFRLLKYFSNSSLVLKDCLNEVGGFNSLITGAPVLGSTSVLGKLPPLPGDSHCCHWLFAGFTA